MSTKTKLIFIDIDGVMNNINDGTSYFLYDPLNYGLSKANIDALKHLLNSTSAKLVISSSWRNHDFDYSYSYYGLLFKSPLKKFIEEIGQSNFYHQDSVPHMKGFQKYFDILGFFYKNDLDVNETSFVVLDDQVNQQLDKFGDNFFLVNSKTGLTKELADSIIVYLNKDEEQ